MINTLHNRPVKVKICGLRREEDIDIVNKYKPDYIGFVFADFSKRFITPDEAAKLKAKLSSDIKAVGVFVDESIEIVIRLLNDGIIDIAQLHGNEDENYITNVRVSTGKEVIKMFNMRNISLSKDDSKEKAELIRQIEESSADYVLLDSGYGTGVTFDWSLPGQIKRPYFLAGGVTPDNVMEAVEALHPFAIDISSGVEVNGFKDEELMLRLLQRIQRDTALDTHDN